ncbi:hypothetical protein ACFFRR_001317 [Megaselia abdita]
MKLKQLILFCILIHIVSFTNALLRRCFQCRSRGELGSCKDPFRFNATEVEDEHGLATTPCASGWCGKVIEGGGTYSADDFDMAIQRMCVQRGPDDNEDRCAYTVYNSRKVFMCFCQGDLCNAGSSFTASKSMFVILTSLLYLYSRWNQY